MLHLAEADRAVGPVPQEVGRERGETLGGHCPVEAARCVLVGVAPPLAAAVLRHGRTD